MGSKSDGGRTPGVRIPDGVKQLVQSNPSNPILVVKDGVYADVNPAFMEIFGWEDKSEVIGRPLSSTMTPESYALSQERVQQRAAGKRVTSSCPYGFIDKHGREFYMPVTAVVWPTDPSIVIGISLGISDERSDFDALRVSEALQRSTSAALRESEARLRNLITNLPGAVYRCAMDEHWTMDYISDAIFAISGYPASDFINDSVRSYASICCEEDNPGSRDEISEAANAGRPFELEYRIVHADGSIRWVHDRGVAASANPDGLAHLDGVIIDITERKRIEQALEAAEDKYHTLVDNIPGAVYRCAPDEDWTMQFVSDDIELITGYPASDFIENRKRTLVSLIAPEDQSVIRETLPRIIRAREPYEVDYQLRRADGSMRWVRDRGRGVFDEDGRLLHSDGILFDTTNATLAKKGLAENEDRFRSLLGNIPGAVYRCRVDENWTMEFVSEGIEILCGYPAADFMDSAWTMRAKIIHPDDVSLVRTSSAEAVASVRPLALEFRVRHADGTVRWVIERAQPVLGDQGELLYYDGVILDATDRRRAEEALAQTEERYRLLAENASDLLWQMDLTGAFTYVSQAIRQFGYEPEDWIGRRLLDFLPPEEQATFIQRFAGDIQDPKSRRYEVQMYRKNGTKVWMEVTLDFVVEQGRPVRLQGIARDISQRRAADAALSESEEKYRTIVENTQDMVMLNTPDGCITYMSSACEAVTGYTPEELVGFKPLLIFPEDFRITESLFQSALRGEHGTNREYRIVTKSGEVKWISHSWAPILGDSGAVRMIVSVVHDIDERRRAEDTLRKAHEDLEKAYDLQREFLNNVTHEVRTPLTAVQGYAKMLLEGIAGPLNEDQMLLLQRIINSSNNLIDVVSAILETARLKSGTVALRPRACKPGDVADIAVASISPQAIHKGLAVNLSVSGKDCIGMYDEEKVVMIMTNLLSNAVKFTAKGEIEVLVDCTAAGFEVVIADSGMGMSQSHLGAVFDEFTQLEHPGKHKPAGFGLGLAIVASMVEAIGASLVVSTRRGIGTAFTLYVPTMDQ